VRQGTRLGRSGRLQVRFDGETIWIAGQTVTVIDGTIRL
jgi:predicted PhzF superfamily epimerase YddE/YHI9